MLKNRIYAVLIVFLGALTVPVISDVTFFFIALLLGCAMFFSKEQWIL